MSVVKAAMTGAAFFAGIAFSVNADAACRADTGEWRHLQPTQQQVDNREDYGVRQQDRAVQSEIDHLYDEIMRAAARRGR